MGIVIIGGFAVVGVEVYKRVTDPERRATTERVRSGAPAQVALDLPEGARIADMVAAGDRVVLRVAMAGGGDRLYVFDPRAGTVTTMVLTGKAAPASP